MTAQRGRSIKSDLIALGAGIGFVVVFWAAWKVGLAATIANAIAQWFVHVIIGQ